MGKAVLPELRNVLTRFLDKTAADGLGRRGGLGTLKVSGVLKWHAPMRRILHSAILRIFDNSMYLHRICTPGCHTYFQNTILDKTAAHALFGHTGGVRFSWPSKFATFYIYRPVIDNFARYVFGL